MMQLHPDVACVMYSAEEIRERISSLAAELKTEYADKNPLVVAILKGSVMFFADLTREMDFPLNMEFMSVSSYGSGTTSRDLRFRKDLDHPIEGRHVLLVEDIIDSGKTLYVLKNRLLERNPASVKICALLDKKARRVSPIDADYVGLPCEDEFVVGYG
ncbi:MAG: hypoxanthine phosphoribosyltransferase, partial [Eubacteriales bacterium]